MPYVNPISGLSGRQIERIDQGVDFAGNGPVAAIGNGQVVQVFSGGSGWPGLGGWVSYRLSDGPAQGHVVYVAEDIQPTVSPGQLVTAGQVIAQMHNTGTGIEMGWANEHGSDTSLAQSFGGYTEGDRTALGANFDQLLVSLGVPASPGINSPNRGTIPSGFPAWGSNIPGSPGSSGQSSVTPASSVLSPQDWFTAIASSLGVPDLKDAAMRLGLILLGVSLIVAGIMINAEQSTKTALNVVKEPLQDAGKVIGIAKGKFGAGKQATQSLKAAGKA